MWCKIVGFSGYWVRRDGRVGSDRRGGFRFLRHAVDRAGYHRVAMYLNGKRRYRSVHRLVLEAFVGPCPAGQEARHLDDDKSNNDAGNLAWGTKLDNKADQRRNGHQVEGEDNGRAKLTSAKVSRMRKLRRAGWTLARLAKKFLVSGPTAYHACVGNTWKHVED